MFTLPPKPPKDFVLKDANNSQATSDTLTPSAYPRATQTSIAVYCSPVQADDNEAVDIETAIEKLNDRVLDLWTKEARASWVPKPGLNDYFIHEICKKYSVVVDPDYDPRYKHRPRIFQRSYNYEFECMEEARLEKLWRKLELEEKMVNDRKQALLSKKEKKAKSQSPCAKVPPFWWKESDEKETTDLCTKKEEMALIPSESTYEVSYKRWIEQPKIIGAGAGDENQRKEDLAKVGQPFQHEACVWYFENYPPPKIKFIPEKFAK